jgi:hypothetical protein
MTLKVIFFSLLEETSKRMVYKILVLPWGRRQVASVHLPPLTERPFD